MIKRVLFFAYGLACYAFFLATFLYAIAFIGGFLVPTRLDAPATAPLPEALLVNCGLLLVFAVQHSTMARPWFKRRWTRIVSPVVERSTFVLFSTLALALLVWQWRPLGLEVWTVENEIARALIWAVFACGWGLVFLATFLINHFDLFGLRQVWLALLGKPYTHVRFRTPLPYRLVRHPLYLGFLLGSWATPEMTLAHLLFAIGITGYILVGIQFEERDLVREHGAAYERYRRLVPMLIPGRRRLPASAADPEVVVGEAVARRA